MTLKNMLKASLVMIGVFVFSLPFLWMLSASLQTLTEAMSTPPHALPALPQWRNYLEAWSSGPFATYTRNSILATFGVMVLQILTIIPAAYAFARFQFTGKNVLWGLTLVCLMIPMQLIFLPNYLMFSKVKLLNTIWPLILPFASSAFGIFMLRQTFMQVSNELIEAAYLDHATEWTIIRKVFLPIGRPTIVTMMLFTFISRWNDYFWPLVMSTTPAGRTLPVGVAMLRTTDTGIPWNIVMAANVILVIPIIIAYLFAQDKIIKAFTYTGIK